MDRPLAPVHPEEEPARLLAIYIRTTPYLQRRIFLRTAPNRYPRFLYKYLPHDIKDAYLDDYFANSVFWLSSAASFNDPFDTSMQVTSEGTIQNKRRVLMAMHKKHRKDLSRQAREMEVSRLMTDNRGIHKIIQDKHQKNVNDMGISCLSEDPRSLLMWSHYASHHKGLVLQFEIAKDPESLTYAFPVEYSKEYPSLNFFEDRRKIIPYALRKFEDWRYEKEWRIVRIGGAAKYHSFMPHALTGIILGCRADGELKAKLTPILENRAKSETAIKQYVAKRHDSRYRLVLERVRHI